jgi:hypothetical protein
MNQPVLYWNEALLDVAGRPTARDSRLAPTRSRSRRVPPSAPPDPGSS